MSIVVCSIACRYADAATPAALWQNLMEGRRSFRPVPPTRLPLDEYSSDVIGEADSITRVLAGLLTDWQFDRLRFKVPLRSFENTDLSHWLALEVASEAIDALGGREVLGPDRTAVIVANTLTGEFSRSSLIRLRKPLLNDLMESALDTVALDPEQRQRVRKAFGASINARFPEPNEDTLAGGLANTIAGRIANYYDLNGGAYSVDGACSSSLIAICNAVMLLESGAADCVISAAVDLSLDPFELVGFSRNGALSASRMRVFDQRADGFWPGEGAAAAVMLREETAAALGLPILARIRGTGLSTDGAGGLTRPDVLGQSLAVERALNSAGLNAADIGYVEAHGTGTRVGDAVEVQALARIHSGRPRSLPIGSIKANIGHTKAAAGMAGLVKLTESFARGVIPPHIGAEDLHVAFAETDHVVELAREAVPVRHAPFVAGLSSFGFGGINVHALLEAPGSRPRRSARLPPAPIGEQNTELFVFVGETPDVIATALRALAPVAASLSVAECADLATDLSKSVAAGPWRLAFLAADGAALAAQVETALGWLSEGASPDSIPEGIFAGKASSSPPVTLVFSGQAAPVRRPSPVWLARFPFLRAMADKLGDVREGDAETSNAQPAITFANIAGAKLLELLGVNADSAIGHSLGEIAALSWAGSLDEDTAIALAKMRGRVMAADGVSDTKLARILADEARCREIIIGSSCEIACLNGPVECVIGGPVTALSSAVARANSAGYAAELLNVSHAFHTKAMTKAAQSFAVELGCFSIRPMEKNVISTVTATDYREQDASIASILTRQFVEPVAFYQAVARIKGEHRIFIECGPGTGFARLIQACGRTALSIDSQSQDLTSFLTTVAELFVRGVSLRPEALAEHRITRTVNLGTRPSLLTNPAGKRVGDQAPKCAKEVHKAAIKDRTPVARNNREVKLGGEAMPPLQAVLVAVSDEIGLPLAQLDADASFQTDLHMNSIAVGRVVSLAAKALGLKPLANPTDFANASPRKLADHLAEISHLGTDQQTAIVSGVRPWFLPYEMGWEAADLSEPAGFRPSIDWQYIDVPKPFTITDGPVLLAQLRELAADPSCRICVLHDGAPVAAMFRSLVLERSLAGVLLIDLNGYSASDPRISQIQANYPGAGFIEFRLAADCVETPRFRRTTITNRVCGVTLHCPVLLAIGCHKGIGAECALLAAKGGEVVFVGRSPEDDPDVRALLELAKNREIPARYVRGDVSDPARMQDVAAFLEKLDISPNILLYAAGVNNPGRLRDLSSEEIIQTLAPKTTGLQNVLKAFGDGLKRVVSFGSIIGRIGLEGEAHYALANQMQSDLIEKYVTDHPECTGLNLEWTVWSGIGMGERLGTIERLQAMGVEPLPFDNAIEIFRKFAHQATGTYCITSRFGQRLDLIGPVDDQIQPPLRFADRRLIHYPGTELIYETTLHPGRDRYLRDHSVNGEMVFPGVVGLEAMSQVASLLGGFCNNARDLDFLRALAVPKEGIKIHISALCAENGDIEAAIFCEEDGFKMPYQRVIFTDNVTAETQPKYSPKSPLAEAGHLYGGLLFHGQRFSRMENILELSSRKIEISVRQTNDGSWYGPFEPSIQVFGSPALLDCALHMLQLTIPSELVLPIAIGRIEYLGSNEITHLVGLENWSKNGTYCFSIFGYDSTGSLILFLSDAKFRTTHQSIDPPLKTDPYLLQPTLERLLRAELSDDIRLAIEIGGRKESRRAMALRDLGLDKTVIKRGDGKPILRGGHGFVSLSHTDDATIAVYADLPIGCDLASGQQSAENTDQLASFCRGEVLRKLGISRPFTQDGVSVDFVERKLRDHDLYFSVGVCRNSDTALSISADQELD